MQRNTLLFNNPYRILGIYGNSTARDISRNKQRLSAFAKVNRDCHFEMDLSDLLGKVPRDTDAISKAEQSINLPNDRLKHALFWFIKNTDVDQKAFKAVQEGNYLVAKHLWHTEFTMSSLVNLSVLAAVMGDIEDSINKMTEMISRDMDRCLFVKQICGDELNMNARELGKLYVDGLLTFMDVDELLPILATSDIDDSVHNELLQGSAKKILRKIRSLMESATPVGIDRLATEVEEQFEYLENYLDDSDLQYREIHDEYADKILYLCQQYVDDDVTNKLKLSYASRRSEYAAKMACSPAKKRECNAKAGEYRSTILLSDLLFAVVSIKVADSVVQMLPLVREHQAKIQQIKQTADFDELVDKVFIIPIRSRVIGIVNELQGSQAQVINNIKSGKLYSEVTAAIQVTNLLKSVASPGSQNQLDVDLKTLLSLRNQLQQVTQRVQQKSGCYIATMVYGDYEHEKVKVLREFRDQVLSTFSLGRTFIRFYYKHSPVWVLKTYNKPFFVKTVKVLLDAFVEVYKYVK